MSLAVLADHMASKGRGGDSMLIHMAPSEIRGLQALAVANGSSLTTNPDTGLPEALSLKKLLPAIIGFGLNYFVPGLGSAVGSALGTSAAVGTGVAVGGFEALRTGDLGKGISAGLGAYGGANLSAGLMEAGTSTIGAAEAAQGVNMTPELLAEFADNGSKDVLLQQQVADRMAAATPYEKLSSGFEAVGKNPMGMAKSLANPLMLAAGPAILAGENVQSKGPQTVTKPGMIRPYSYDPYGGTYTAGTPYEAQVKKVAGGGLMGMDDGGYGPGMLDFTQKSEPVVRMASGGIAGYAVGGAPAMLSDEQLYQQTGSWEAAAAARDEQNRAANIYADAQRLMAPAATTAAPAAAAPVSTPAYFTQNPDVAAAFTQNSYGMTPEAFAQTHFDKYGQAEGRTLPSAAANYAAANNINLTGNINQWVADNPFATAAQVTAEAKKYGISDTDIQRALTANTSISDAARYALTHNMGLAGLQQGVLAALKANPNATQAQIDAAQAQYGLSNADIQSPLIHGYQVDPKQDAAALKYLSDNPDVARWVSSAEGQDYIKTHPEFDAKDIAFTHYKRYGEAEGRKWGATTPIVVTDTFNPPIIPGVNDYGLGGTGTSGRLENVLGTALPPGVSGAGITTVNPNGTITTRPNIPGIPEGGFTGMTSLRDAYTKGGGSLGYIPYAPKTIDEFNTKYGSKLTGGSKQSYDYLTGKTPYDPTPYTKTGEIMKPYWESVGRFPENRKAKKYVFVNGKYELNPDYVKPSYVLAGEKAAADKAAAETTKAGVDAGKTINVLDKEGQTEVATLRSDGKYYTSGGDTYDEYGKRIAADGGLMAMARGGMTQQFDLGGYSDGGRLLRGPGDGVSDSIPATIGGKRPARLADGEFVVPARIVSELGNGSTEAGARKLYAMMDRIQKARRGTVGKGRVAKNSRSEKYLPA